MQPARYSLGENVLQERNALAKAFSPLRRIRPRVPFWQLAAHRIPTLWSLYRGLLKEAPNNNLRWRMRLYFERYKDLTSPSQTRDRLLFTHKLLDAFRSANEGDEKMSKVLVRYGSLVAVKREKARMETVIRQALTWQERLRNRPILTGALIRPTSANGPLPRMRPQPEHITMMIRRRRLAYERASGKLADLKNSLHDFENERMFENRLLLESMSKGIGFQSEFASEDWGHGIKDHQKLLKGSITLARQRAVTPPSDEMLAVIKEARREKIRNKTHEKERERRGEVLKSTLRRRRKRPPAHVISRMSDTDRRRDQIARGVSEVGYVGMVKDLLGRRMKNPTLWNDLGR